MIAAFSLFLLSIPCILPLCEFGGQQVSLPDHCVVEFYISTFEEAQQICRNVKGRLPLIKNRDDERNFYDSDAYTFLWPLTQKGIFNYSSDFWLGWKDGKWLDNSTVEETKYTRYKGNDTPPLLVMDRFKNKWTEPKQKTAALCEYPNFSECEYSAPFFGYVDTFSKRCLMFQSSSSSYSYAYDQCTWYPFGQLVTVKNALENEIVYTSALNMLIHNKQWGEYVWLGYSPGGPNWVDGTPLTYDNFARSVDRKKMNDSDYCLVMLLNSGDAGKWDFRDCNYHQQGYTACQVNYY